MYGKQFNDVTGVCIQTNKLQISRLPVKVINIQDTVQHAKQTQN